MLAIFATVLIKPGYRDKYIEAVKDNAVGATKNEPGCYRFDVLRDDSDPDRVYLYEVWQDEAALAAHGSSPHYKRLKEIAGDWYARPVDVLRLSTVFPADEAWAQKD